MNKREAEERIEKLKKTIDRHRYLYHVLDRQEISESALDSLKHELKKLEEQHPEFLASDSPTQRVSGKPLESFKKVRHLRSMLSLEDVFDGEEFEEWIPRIKKLLPSRSVGLDFFAESKFDGLAISVIYEKGVLKKASTRGDGKIGEDVTQNIKTIESIPLRIEHKNIRSRLSDIEVRGEVIISHKAFKKINEEQQKKGEKIYANPRNLAAGSVRQLDPKITASRHLDFYAWDIADNAGRKLHSDEHEILKTLGFKIDRYAKICHNAKEVEEFRERFIKNIRLKLDYDVDGIVVSVNNNSVFGKLGAVGKAPRGAVAFKFAPKEAVTKIENIKIQVGRTGVLTPVAILKPVKIGGVIVSRATLHNEDEIKRLGLKIGDSVIVGRAGDVIPDVRKVLKDLRSGKEKAFHMPADCPRCGRKVFLEESGKILRCVNEKCPARKREALYHFVSKKGFDISGLGPKIIDALLDNGLIQDAADIFDLKGGDLIPIERFAEKSAGNLTESIKKSREISLPKFIVSLGILHIGEETAQLLAKRAAAKIKNQKSKIKINEFLKYFQEFSFEELQKIMDVGPVMAKSVYDWFHNGSNIKFLEKLGKTGIEIQIPSYKLKAKSYKLKNKTFVLTGALASMPRDEAKEKIRALGGGISESVSKNTDFVVSGGGSGFKYDKARKLGVKILAEKEFLDMIK